MVNSDEGIGVTLDFTDMLNGYIWFESEEVYPNQNAAPNATTSADIVLNKPAVDTDITAILEMTSGISVFLTQEALHTGYVCTLGVDVQDDEATVTFEYGDEEDPDTYGYMTLDATNDDGWVVNGVSGDSGFSEIVAN